jgi:adenylate cyclase
MWLKSKEKKIQEELDYYFPARIIEKPRQCIPDILSDDLDGPKNVLSVSFTNMTGYVSVCEKLKLRDLKSYMDKYFDIIINTVESYEGNIDQISGDAISSFWGLNSSTSATANIACQCALEQLKNIEEIFYPWAREMDFPSPQVRIGISSGEVLIANMGREGVFQFSPIGIGVNSAIVLCDRARNYNPPILIDNPTKFVITDFEIEEEINIPIVDGKTMPANHLIQKTQ